MWSAAAAACWRRKQASLNLRRRPPAPSTGLSCPQTKDTPREQYEAQYRQYFVWAAVRNPWARAVSSYRMLSRYMRRECKARGAAAVSEGVMAMHAEGRCRMQSDAWGDAVEFRVCKQWSSGRAIVTPICCRVLSRSPPRPLRLQDLVGGWDTVCRDLNHMGRLHNEHPECTMSK